MIKLISLLLILSCANFKTHFNKRHSEKKTFNLAWAKNLDPKYNLGNLPVGWSTPLIHLRKVYVGTPSGSFNVYDLETGRLLKEIDEGGKIVMKPVIDSGKIYYGTSRGKFVVRNLSSYELIFEQQFDTPLESSLDVDGDTVYFRLRTHSLIAFDYKKKKVVWRYQRSPKSMTSLNRMSSPLISGESVFGGFADGHLVSIDKSSGKLNWEAKLSEMNKFEDVDMNPLIIKDRLWIGSLAGPVHVIDAKSGQTLRRLEHKILARPLTRDLSVYLFTDRGEMIITDLDGNIKQNLKVSKSGITSSSFWGKEKIVFSTFKSEIGALYLADLNRKDYFNLGYSRSSILGNLEEGENFLAVYSSRNRLYVFK